MTPILSVLIPTVPARREAAWKLFDKITAQAEGQPVEVLVLLDNKKRSTGLKRDALLQASAGDYIAFADDDDDVSEHYIKRILTAASVGPWGVIVFDTDCSLNGASPVRIRHSLRFPNEQYNPAGFKRGPWQMHAWRGMIARAVRFPDLQNGEDSAWCAEMKRNTFSYAKIEEVLYHYRYDHETTEASK